MGVFQRAASGGGVGYFAVNRKGVVKFDFGTFFNQLFLLLAPGVPGENIIYCNSFLANAGKLGPFGGLAEFIKQNPRPGVGGVTNILVGGNQCGPSPMGPLTAALPAMRRMKRFATNSMAYCPPFHKRKNRLDNQ